MADSLCSKCAALCCRYFAMQIDNPKTVEEYDNIRWYLCHENVVVFIEKKLWYVGIMSRCKHLQPDNRCGIYETRPRICRKYTTDNCDYHGGEYDFEQLFTSAEQLRVYAEEKLNRNRRGKRRLTLVPPTPKPKMRKRRIMNGKAVAISLPVLPAPMGPPAARELPVLSV